MSWRLIGVDCAVDPARVGLALAQFDDGSTRLLTAQRGSGEGDLAATIGEWIQGHEPVLLALDAPLGWPEPLGRALARHVAGAPISGSANELFRRLTDNVVRDEIGRQPLDVGADRIARTAHAALALLAQLRALTGHTIPLAWEQPPPSPVAAIEVYPAATLMAHGLAASGYKDRTQTVPRRMILAALRTHMQLPPHLPALIEEPDALDATLCVLAASDFLRGDVIRPIDIGRARAEGWIWVRRRR